MSRRVDFNKYRQKSYGSANPVRLFQEYIVDPITYDFVSPMIGASDWDKIVVKDIQEGLLSAVSLDFGGMLHNFKLAGKHFDGKIDDYDEPFKAEPTMADLDRAAEFAEKHGQSAVDHMASLKAQAGKQTLAMKDKTKERIAALKNKVVGEGKKWREAEMAVSGDDPSGAVQTKNKELPNMSQNKAALEWRAKLQKEQADKIISKKPVIQSSINAQKEIADLQKTRQPPMVQDTIQKGQDRISQRRKKELESFGDSQKIINPFE